MLATPAWKPKIAKLWSKSQSAAAGRLPFALFICGLLAYAAAFAWHMLSNFDLVNIIRDVNADDSFYYFQIAYNLVHGKFSTFDGGITQTNGYYPVWLLLITPFYWVFDKEAALFGIKAFEIMLVGSGVALIAAAARVARLAWALLFAALPMLYRLPLELLQGLEAAAALFTLSLLILAVCLYIRDPQRWKWHLAAISFTLPWVRIEYIAISLAVTAALCAIEWSRMERRSPRLSELAAIRHTYIPLIGATAGILVYFAYNRLVFGAALPVNTLTKRAWAQLKWTEEGGYSLVQNFWDTLALRAGIFDYELLIAFEICAYLLLTWWLALRSNDRRGWLLLAFLVGMFGLAAGHIAKFAQSVLTIHLSDAYELWYFVPAYLMTALIIPVRLYIAIYLIHRFVAPRRRIAANALSVSVVVIGAAILLGTADFAAPFKWVERKSGPLYRQNWQLTSYMGAQVINRALPEGSVVGSWDAGVIGYFSRFPVVNLDGLVNSYDYFHARYIAQAIETEGEDFYRRYGVTHFANTQATAIDQYAPIENNMIFEGVPHDYGQGKYQFRIWTYDPPPNSPVEIDHSHWVWDNLAPRFDYLSDGVGVISDGRTAHAFIKDCRTDETLVWTWQDHKRETSVKLHVKPYISRANMCIDARILPHSAARQSAQAKIATGDAYAYIPTPIIQSNFDASLANGSLIFTKSQCDRQDTAAAFFISVFPANPNDLSQDHKPHGYHSIEFNFHDYGAINADGMCQAAVTLPRYPIDAIHAGQYAATDRGYRYLWQGDYKIGAGAYRATAKPDLKTLKDRQPDIQSTFDVHLIDRSLIYAKSQCNFEDAAAPFFIRISPLYADDLPSHIQELGYVDMEFTIADYEAAPNGMCWAQVDLPKYPIAAIHTGQYIAIEDGYHYLWDGNLYPIRAQPDFNMPPRAHPVIRSKYDVYLSDRRLIYAKRQCDSDDTAARFFASVFPVHAADLADDDMQRGYHSIEFDFHDYGAINADGMCFAQAWLPPYPVSEIHTGQYLAVADSYHYPWDGRYRVGEVNQHVGAQPDFRTLTDHEPIIRSDFDVYFIADRLIFAKERCGEEHVAARFFITITPAYEDSLPERGSERGHAATEFYIAEDTISDGNCWAEASLPNYPISEIRTGQYLADADGYLWEATYLNE